MTITSNLLPRCRGPKMGPFLFQNTLQQDFEVLGFLGSGLHSEVFKVKIEGKTYALKAFRFYRAQELAIRGLVEGGYVGALQVHNQKAPFNAECRAYGRLQETSRTDLAISCYGHLMLTRAQEAKLAEHGANSDTWDRRPEHLGMPVHCLIKEYVDSTTFFTRSMLPKMKKDIVELNRLGIVVFDLRKENYLNGKLIDFSQAHVVPHYELDLTMTWNLESAIKRLCVIDYVCFDDLVDDWNRAHPDQPFWRRFFPSRSYRRKLRSGHCDPAQGKKMTEFEVMNDDIIP